MTYKRLLITTLLSLVAVAVGMLGTPVASFAGVSIGVAITLPPPALPVYTQPIWPGPGYIWTPGYWAWDDVCFCYYWVPGTWVLPPAIGLLWTPGYWNWYSGAFVWVAGYWGPVVGFYGGINYGFGYPGFGYYGGYWRGDTFYYNRTVNNINVTNVTNVYSQTVSRVRPSGASFNGGSGGTTARPTSEQLAAASQKRFSLTNSQKLQMRVARANPEQRATVNKGRPTIAATAKPGVFTGSNVAKASSARDKYKAPSGTHSAAAGTNARTSHAAGVERHKSVNESVTRAPHTPSMHSVAPRNEPRQQVYRHNELRPAPEHRGLAQQPSAPYSAYHRPSVTHQPSAPYSAYHRPSVTHQPSTPYSASHGPSVAHQPSTPYSASHGPSVAHQPSAPHSASADSNCKGARC